jgi:tRNA pseudouridine55 synthase
LNGFLLLDKPEGVSSFFVVNRCKKILGAKRAGHLGTLDPFATGLLIIAINSGTKVIPYVTIKEKCYDFEIKFGEKMNTGDKTGTIIETNQNIPNYRDIESILPAFLGEIHQKPHPFSAVKVNGKRAYQIARSGQDPIIAVRSVTIFDLCLLMQTQENVFLFRATVSPGTYIRSLAEDVARSLETVGHVVSLKRTRDGKFKLEDAITIDRLAEKKENIDNVLISLENILDDIPVYFVTDREAGDLALGKSVNRGVDVAASKDGVCLVASEEGMLWIAEVKASERSLTLSPKRLLVC